MRDISPLLPFILRHENVAVTDGDALYITDRRSYPFERKRVKCHDAFEAADAVRNMVTQGGGPLEAALQAMILTAVKSGKDEEAFVSAVRALSDARPTNTTMKRELEGILPLIISSFDSDGFALAVENLVNSRLHFYDECYLRMAENGVSLLSDGDGILTTCFPEHSFFLTLALARENGLSFSVFAPETRPYLQGARLTASSLAEMGYEHTLITDGMPSTFMSCGKITKYMTASDLALRDKTVVNKTGTLGNAIAAKFYGIPYYPFAISFDDAKKSASDVIIEYRNPEEVKVIRGVRTCSDDVNASYPCFDIIQPSLVTGIVMPGGVIK
ncbi:MAG: translation initiation factor 2 [Bullifex sp.]